MAETQGNQGLLWVFSKAHVQLRGFRDPGSMYNVDQLALTLLLLILFSMPRKFTPAFISNHQPGLAGLIIYYMPFTNRWSSIFKMKSNGSDIKDAFGNFHFHCVSLLLGKLCTWPKISCSISSASWRSVLGWNKGRIWWEEVLIPPTSFSPPGSIWRLSSNSIIFYRWIFADQHHPPSVLVNNCHLPVTFPICLV